MKIIILTKNLKTALENLSVVIEKKRPTLPILKMISFKTWEKNITTNGNVADVSISMLELMATNIDQALKASLTCHILEEGEGCIDAAGLLAICKKTKEPILEIEIIGEVATVKAGEVVLKLEAGYFSDFPILSGDLPELGKLAGLVDALNFVKEAIANDKTRFYLNGANLKSVGENLDIVATDGHLLLKTSVKSDLKLDCIIPQGTVKTILKVFEGSLKIGFDKSKIKICGGDYELISKLIDGEFPEYQRLIPKGENVLESQIDAKKLSEAIKQIEPEVKFKAIKFKFGEKLQLESEAGKASIDCGGEEFLTAFEAGQFLAVCKTFGNFKMSFKGNYESAVAVIENDLGLGVIMPCRI